MILSTAEWQPFPRRNRFLRKGSAPLRPVLVSNVVVSEVRVSISPRLRKWLLVVSLLIPLGSVGCQSKPPHYSTAQAGVHRARFLQQHNAQLSAEQKRLIQGLPYSSDGASQAAQLQRILGGP